MHVGGGTFGIGNLLHFVIHLRKLFKDSRWVKERNYCTSNSYD